jgi:hypothetical protein
MVMEMEGMGKGEIKRAIRDPELVKDEALCAEIKNAREKDTTPQDEAVKLKKASKFED